MDAPTKPKDQWIFIREHSEGGVIFAEAQPGDGTRYPVLITPVTSQMAARIGCSPRDMACTLFWNKPRTLVFDPHGFLHYSYVMEKMEMASIPSAVTLACILGILTGVEHMEWDDEMKKRTA